MFNIVIVAVVGSSKSGKTTTIEALIQGLTKRGYTVGSAKHIPETEFTIDKEGKDTWRHAKAGARIVLSVAPKELAVIQKVESTNYSLEQVIAKIPEEIDVIFTEGFKSLVGSDTSIPKLVIAKTKNEVSQAMERYKNILAFVTSVPSKRTESEIPFVDGMKEPEKLVELVNKKVEVLLKRKRKRGEKITIQVDGNFLPLGDFVQDIVRNTVLGMIGSLKGIKIKGEEKVSVVIKRQPRD